MTTPTFASTLPALALAKAATIRLMIFDVDGVLTDGGLFYGEEGEAFKRFNALDGHGIKLMQQYGTAAAIITARQSPYVLRRARDLGIAHVFQGVHDKRQAFEQLLQQLQLAPAACGYLGDDIIDLPVLTRVGFKACVANGHREVKSRCDYVTQASGGHGAVREICDLVLAAQGNYEAALAPYLA
ncbi:KdsC family phosphatase [Herbaspirillum rubrisubalbicans]|uniref:3-deoxy-D-manno-octulosonate 8-phosphate phosphatase KdsC n=1 Tax=Herbaspirillum rubrisubalbicans TaxID=80842 RepID=A0AAD0UCS2_9BURK|nr:HAD hydrolase family protein [Herbaspirillum rubrisubalbicans]ALU91066.1 3-deoxy-D-manno-octulosonate 8-phosphate phosphatase [Herbaspirillum rubrisubalbicans M1]AYR26097.1 phenylphosphate carboxylase subunit delta [Herbaspirillum rubrisubalbicans]